MKELLKNNAFGHIHAAFRKKPASDFVSWKSRVCSGAISLGMLATPGMYAYAEPGIAGNDEDSRKKFRADSGNGERRLDVFSGEATNATIIIDPDIAGIRTTLAKKKVSTKADGEYAIRARNGSSALVSEVQIHTAGNAAHGIDMANLANIEMRGISIVTTGDKAAGIIQAPRPELLPRPASVLGGTAIHSARVETRGREAEGVLARGGRGRSRMDVSDTLVLTGGDKSPGIRALGSVVSVGGTEVDTAGEASNAVEVREHGHITVANSALRTKGSRSAGAGTLRSTMDIAGSVIITAGHDASGVLVSDSVARLKDTQVRAEGTDAWGAVSEGGQLYLDGGTLFSVRHGALLANNAEAPGTLISLANGAVVTGGNGVLLGVEKHKDRDMAVDLQMREKAVATGDILTLNEAGRSAVINVSISDGAQWRGSTRAVEGLALAGDGRWIMDNDSRVGALSLADSTVVFERFPSAGFHSLEIKGKLEGNGLFVMNTDLAAQRADSLQVKGQAEGAHRVLVRNTGGEPALRGESLRIIETGGGNAAFSLVNRNQVVEAGVYQYELQKHDGTGGESVHWDLVQRLTLSATAGTVVDTTGTATTRNVWNAELGALNKRLNELRWGDGQAGMWTRSVNSRQYIDNRIGCPFTQHVNGFAFGADRAADVKNGQWHFGALTGYSKAKRYFKDDGKGDSSSVHIGAYAVLTADNGVYASGVVTANRFRHGFAIRGSDGGAVKGNFGTRGLGAALEAGRLFPLQKGWFVEPQAGIDYFQVGGARYRTDNGMAVQSLGGHSLQLRAGSRMGRDIELGNGKVVKPFVKLGWVQELANKSRVRANGIAMDSDMAGGRFEMGLGLDAKLGKGHSLYLDYEYAKGRNFEQPWAFGAGYRYNW